MDYRDGKVWGKCHSCDAPERDFAESLGLRHDEFWDVPAQDCEVCGKLTLADASGRYVHERCSDRASAGGSVPASGRTSSKSQRRRVGQLPARLTRVRGRQVGRREIVEVDEHIDLDGVVVARNVRQQFQIRLGDTEELQTRKTFYQEFTDGRNGWGNKEVLPPGMVVPLWRAHEVATAIIAGETIWLTEGHKDGRALLKAGADAVTTNIDGAGNFGPDDAQQLRGAHVVIVCDRDLAGYRRGVDVTWLLMKAGVASSRCVLPAVMSRHSDAHDHVAAGFGLSDFLPVTVEQLECLALLEEAARLREDPISHVIDELDARLARMDLPDHDREAEHRAAQRWAVEAGRTLLKIAAIGDRLRAHAGHDANQVAQFGQILSDAAEITAASHEHAGCEPEADVAGLLRLLDNSGGGGSEPPSAPTASDADDEFDGKVRNFPARPTMAAPAIDLPMSRERWRYDLGDNVERGVYLLQRDTARTPGRWVKMADLPYVVARIVRRDGEQKPCGTDYLLTAEEDARPLVVNHHQLRDGTWANELGIAMSDDSKVQQAASTAIRLMGASAPLREAIPRIDPDSGRVGIAAPETLPVGYLQCAPVERTEAMSTWTNILTIASGAPKLALLLGASAVAPFIGALDRQSHFVALYGDANQGKTVALKLAGAIWGDADQVKREWNTSKIASMRYCGSLGILPPIFDESGMTEWGSSPGDWGRLIYDITEGAQRMTSELRGPGIRLTQRWDGVVITAGNGRLTDGLGAGKFAGVAKRVIDLATPITHSADQAEALGPMMRAAYGHLGSELLEHVTVDQVKALVEDTASDLPLPETGSRRTVTKHLQSHVAGAALLDTIAGTGTLLRDAAFVAAGEYLAQWDEPEHDADRMVAEVTDSMSREPWRWPTQAEYAEIRTARESNPGLMSPVPQHGVAPEVWGWRADDGDWVAVSPAFWRAACQLLEVDSSAVIRELHRRGELLVTAKQRKAGDWLTRIRTGQWVHRSYKLSSTAFEGDSDEDGSTTTPPADDGETPDQTPSSPPDEETIDRLVPDLVPDGSGSVPGGVPGQKPAVTRGVPGVPGKTSETSHVPARESAGAMIQMSDGNQIAADPTRPLGPYSAVDGSLHQRGWALEPGPCAVCGRTCTPVVDGRRIHFLCLDNELLSEAAELATEPVTPEETAAPSVPAPNAPTPRSETPRQSSIDPGGHEGRWSAPAAVLDADLLYLPGQEPQPWDATDLGDVAALVGQLRLGWGGGEDRLPDPGQLYLLTGALQRLGLPVDLDLPDGLVSDEEWDKAREDAYQRVTDLPAVQAAKDGGWNLGHGGVLQPWTRMWHPDRRAADNAQLIMLPWVQVAGVPVIEGVEVDDSDAPAPLDPQAMAERLLGFAQATGITYRLSPAASALDLIDHARPPRSEVTDDRGHHRNRVAVVRNTPADLPPFLATATDNRFTNLEADFSWWRTYDSLLAEETDRANVVLFDRGKSYLAQWESLDLGVEGLVHRVGDEAAWDGSEKPGYYLVDAWEWGLWWLPDPGEKAGARVEGGRIWVTSHTLKQLLRFGGIEPTAHESYTWTTTSRYLEVPAKRLKEALRRDDLDPAVEQTIKQMYSGGTGKLGERDAPRTYHLRRPDWRHHVIASSRTAIMAHLQGIKDGPSGALPILVDRDTIGYVTDAADPWEAWPGDPKKLGTAVGQWKPVGIASLAEWGPKHLTPRRPGRMYFRALDAVEDLTPAVHRP